MTGIQVLLPAMSGNSASPDFKGHSHCQNRHCSLYDNADCGCIGAGCHCCNCLQIEARGQDATSKHAHQEMPSYLWHCLPNTSTKTTQLLHRCLHLQKNILCLTSVPGASSESRLPVTCKRLGLYITVGNELLSMHSIQCMLAHVHPSKLNAR